MAVILGCGEVHVAARILTDSPCQQSILLVLVVFCGKPVHSLIFTLIVHGLHLRLLEVVVALGTVALESKLGYHLVTVVVDVGPTQV